MENKIIKCKHNVQLAFNGNEIVSYCIKCGKILDRYVKAKTIQTWDYVPITYCGNVNSSVTLKSDDTKSTIKG